MSRFDNLLARGFAAITRATSAPTLTANGQTRPCIATPIVHSKEFKDQGFWEKFACRAELLRTDAAALGLADRASVLYEDANKRVKHHLKVMAIEDDPSDPCVQVTLKEDPQSGR